MHHLLNDQKIASTRARIDNTELNTALNLAHYLTKKNICSLKIKDVFDGSDILPVITFNSNQTPRKTEGPLKNILRAHINYLQQKQSIDQDAPLFPGYFDDGDGKKLRRHISLFTDHHDFNAVKKALRVDQNEKLAQVSGDSKDRIKDISGSSGKSERTIARSLGLAPVGQGKNLSEKTDRFLKMLDAPVVWPKVLALEEDAVFEAIIKGFEIIDGEFQGQAREEMRYHLIMGINDRVEQIEKELLDKRKSSSLSVDKSGEAGGPLRQLLNDIAKRHAELEEHKQVLTDEPQELFVEQDPFKVYNDQKAFTEKERSKGEIVTNAEDGIHIPKPTVSEQIIMDKINGLFSRIERVRSMILPEEWQQWKDWGASLQEASSSEQTNGSTEDDYLEKKLHKKRRGSQRPTFQRDTQEDRQKQRKEYIKEQIICNYPDHSFILQKAVELIKHTALYCHEVTDLCIKNVIRAEHRKIWKDEKISTEWIVDEIVPLTNEYPKGCNKLCIPLSKEAKEIIREEIEFIQDINDLYLGGFSVKTPLFPLYLSPSPYYNRSTKTEEKPKIIKTSPQQRRINRFKSLLNKKLLWVDGGYERLREQGIRQYYLGLIKGGLPMQDVIQRVQRYARYSDEKEAIKIISKIQKQTSQ